MIKKFRILVTSNSFGEAGLKILREHAEIVRSPGPLGEEELLKEVKGIDAVVASHDHFTKRVIEEAEDLKVIGRHGIGYSEIDIDAATEYGIFVTYTPVPLEFESVADFTIGLMLALVRKISNADSILKKGLWKRTPFIGFLLKDKTVGIIGLGNIGSRVAKRLAGFGVRMICYDPYISKETAKKCKVKLVDLTTLLRESDIISLHCPLTKETRDLISWREVELMKPGVFVINTARGPIFPRDALFKALVEGKIAGAALDVYEEEPPNLEEPLFKLDNVVATPHIAAYTEDALRSMDIAVARDVLSVLKGKAPKYLVNKELLKQ